MKDIIKNGLRAGNCLEIIDDAGRAHFRYPDAETQPCTCGCYAIDLLVTFDASANGRLKMYDSELVKAAREGKPVILNNVDWLPYSTRRVLRKIIRAAEYGRNSIVINGRYITFKAGFKAVAVTKEAYL